MPTDDNDSDGMPNGYELANSGCLNYLVADSGLDPDTDNLTSLSEMAVTTDPRVNGTDADGCADGEETGTNPFLGGGRNPRKDGATESLPEGIGHWDFYDVNGSGKVDSVDSAIVRSKIAPSTPTSPENRRYDRGNTETWGGPPDGFINAIDFGLVRAQFNHSCQAAP